MLSMMLFLAGVVLVHYVTHNGNSSKEMLSSITKITKLSSPSLSVTYYEPRILSYENLLNPAYPQMQTMNKMNLVYVKQNVDE